MKTRVLLTILICAFILLFAASAVHAILQTDQNSYLNNQTIHITGTSDQETVQITASNHGVTVFQKSAPTQNNSFFIDYAIQFLDPTGDWKIHQQDDNSSVYVTIQPVAESATIVLTFTSPSPGTYKRTRTIPISIQAMLNGEPLQNATIAILDPTGKKTFLETTSGNGNYSLDYRIPADAPLGDWVITAVAEAYRENNRIGGTNRHTITIERTPLYIAETSTVFANYEIGQAADIVLTATYFDSSPANDIEIHGTWNSQALLFKKQSDESYAAHLLFGETNTGEQTITAEVKDKFGNTGIYTKKISVSGESEWFLKKYGLFVLLAIAGFLIALFFFYSKYNTEKKLQNLREQEQNLHDQTHTLEHKYFTEQSINRTNFEQQNNDLSKQKALIAEQIRRLEEKHK